MFKAFGSSDMDRKMARILEQVDKIDGMHRNLDGMQRNLADVDRNLDGMQRDLADVQRDLADLRRRVDRLEAGDSAIGRHRLGGRDRSGALRGLADDEPAPIRGTNLIIDF